jgi:DNA-binding beta-propeller fold protein YncE
VATEAGKTYVLSLPGGSVEASFASPPGGRLAVVSPGGGHVYVIGGAFTAAYDTAAPYKQVGMLKQGGNAFVISPGGHHAYLAGNFRSNILKLNLPGLTVAATAGVGKTGDLAISPDGKRIWAADMFNGDLYVLDTAGMRLAHTINTPEGDPRINFSNLMAATAGFMQLSMSHTGKHLYAAGFSGHVLVFNTSTYNYTSLTVKVPPGKAPAMSGSSGTQGTPAPAKLSGLVVLPSGRRLITTAENYKTTLLLSTRTGKTLAAYPGVTANRWIVVKGQ